MKLAIAVFAVLLLTPILSYAQSEKRLAGCVDPQLIARVIRTMQHSDALSVEGVRAMWPNELSDTENSPTVRSVRSDDRILNGNCLCCNEFSFKIRQERVAKPEGLYHVTVNYSAHNRATLVAIAKLLGTAVGLRETDQRRVGKRSSETFSLEKYLGSERRFYTIEIRFTREAGLWKMYFLSSWFVVEPVVASKDR